MDTSTNEIITNRNTVFLEQCRAEIDAIAAQGAAALDEAVTVAEKQLRACTMEWRQASKTLEMTAEQQKMLNETRSATEERMAAVRSEEEDAQLTAATVRRMIEDANNVRNSSNTDSARILSKASEVLVETCQRAEVSFEEKRAQRQEVEAALQRLEATEKAVQYSIAKAERNVSEKILVRLMAERRCDVYKAECDAIHLEDRYQQLTQQRSQQLKRLHELDEQLVLARGKVSQCEQEEQALNETAAAELIACQQSAEQSVGLISADISRLQQERDAARDLADRVRSSYEQLLAQHEEAELLIKQAQNNYRNVSREALQEQEQKLAEIEADLDELRRQTESHSAACDNAKAVHEQAMSVVAQFNARLEDCRAKVKEASDAELGASDAAATALRLADNAIKVRESISVESSDLLLHAQEVLMEAAASAQQMVEEKKADRLAAELICEEVQHQVAVSSDAADMAELNMEMEQVDLNKAQQRLQEAVDLANQKRQALLQATQARIAAAEQEQREAEQAIAKLQPQIVTARETLDNTLSELDGMEERLSLLLENKQQAEREGVLHLQETRQRNAELANKLTVLRGRAESGVERNLLDGDQLRQALQTLDQEMDQVYDLCRATRAKVDEIVAMGLIDIISAEEVVGGCQYRERMARAAVGDMVSFLAAADHERYDRLSRGAQLAEIEEETAVPLSLALLAPAVAMANAEQQAAPAADTGLAAVPFATETAPVAGESLAADEPLSVDEALVDDKALAEEEALIEDETLAEEEALIEDETLAEEEALIEDEALVEEDALIEDEALVEEDALIEDEALVEEEALTEDELAPDYTANEAEATHIAEEPLIADELLSGDAGLDHAATDFSPAGPGQSQAVDDTARTAVESDDATDDDAFPVIEEAIIIKNDVPQADGYTVGAAEPAAKVADDEEPDLSLEVLGRTGFIPVIPPPVAVSAPIVEPEDDELLGTATDVPKQRTAGEYLDWLEKLDAADDASDEDEEDAAREEQLIRDELARTMEIKLPELNLDADVPDIQDARLQLTEPRPGSAESEDELLRSILNKMDEPADDQIADKKKNRLLSFLRGE